VLCNIVQNDTPIYKVSVVAEEGGAPPTLPLTLQNMIDAFNSLNETIRLLVSEATKLYDEVCVHVCVHSVHVHVLLCLHMHVYMCMHVCVHVHVFACMM